LGGEDIWPSVQGADALKQRHSSLMGKLGSTGGDGVIVTVAQSDPEDEMSLSDDQGVAAWPVEIDNRSV